MWWYASPGLRGKVVALSPSTLQRMQPWGPWSRPWQCVLHHARSCCAPALLSRLAHRLLPRPVRVQEYFPMFLVGVAMRHHLVYREILLQMATKPPIKIWARGMLAVREGHTTRHDTH